MFGLDISDRTLRIAALTKKRANICISSIGSIAIPAGLIKEGEILNSDKLIPHIQRLIKSCEPKKVKCSEVTACLPERQSFIKVIQISNTSNRPVDDLVKEELVNHVPYPMDEIYLDWQTVKNTADGKTEILVGVVPKKIVDTYQETLKKAGLVTKVLEIESVAIARSLLPLNWDEKKAVLIIDLGLDRTSFIICDHGMIQFTSGVTNISGNEMTNAIVGELTLSFAEAEKAKKLAGFNRKIGKGAVTSALQESLKILLNQTSKVIDYYHEHDSTSPISRIILSGGGANLKLLDKVMTEKLKIIVQKGDSIINLEKNNIAPLTFENQLSFATAIGLALRGIIYDNT